ncbi:UDP-N-acetylmuramate dehydrogenase [Patescibacteria group bacterium]|nr:UDP-N-acetylmuramate dehydrogenase [Patescibacteria group bacterium]
MTDKDYQKNQKLSAYTSFRLGGPADWLYQVKNEKDLIEAIAFCRQKKIPFLILGGGSNILFSDKGFRGMIIRMENRGIKIENEKVIAGAGSPLNKLVKLTAENSLTGLEFLAGIYGTVGGAIVGNAGAWQENIGDKVKRVEIFDKNHQFKWLNREKCQFAYRQSRFKKNEEIILKAEFKLKKGNEREIKRKIGENMRKREKQPKESSAGSIFINPKPKSAGLLIEACGLKGKKIGKAQISEKHANFIVNLGGAKAADVLELIALAQKKVKEKFKITLQPEIIILDENGNQIHY